MRTPTTARADLRRWYHGELDDLAREALTGENLQRGICEAADVLTTYTADALAVLMCSPSLGAACAADLDTLPPLEGLHALAREAAYLDLASECERVRGKEVAR
jgi:hypothetical protein